MIAVHLPDLIVPPDPETTGDTTRRSANLAEVPHSADRSAGALRFVRVIGPLFLALLLGVACYCGARAMMNSGVKEGTGWLAWFAMLSIAAFVIGCIARARIAFCAAMLMVAVQSVGLYWTSAESGEIERPSRSTGGMAGVCIMSAFLFMGSPMVLLGAWGGGLLSSSWRTRRRFPWTESRGE